ncbi:MAG: tRNA (N(6)-L-threonylcarbamoyladenosine(37)-C(2))-methylthiotransferase MtaB [Coriobacteriales bacterium]|jgi:threonylcarbamoyladenosine tRNA methylthiotransferase MtaB
MKDDQRETGASPAFSIHTLGCKVNRAESESIASALLEQGWHASGDKDADIVIVNTCTVTGEADHKNRKLIRGLLKSSGAPIIVTGCAVNVDADHYADLDARVTCVRSKGEIPALARKLTERAASPSLAQTEPAIPLSHGDGLLDGLFRTRVDVKIQDGCDNACTYCIVHTARGPARSLSAASVIERIDSIARTGTQEAVLVGIDLGAYQSEGLDLAGLLETLVQKTGIGRIRISSLEPQNLTRRLIDVLAKSDGRICRHLHLCLQSGSDRVLHEMARHYGAEEFRSSVEQLRAAVPGIALSTDVIVGFPGETDADFEQTMRMVEDCGFMRLHVFRYSKRPGTPAAERNDQVPPEVSAKRAESLRKLGAQLAAKDRAHRVGSCEQVVIERPGIATSESYHKVLVPRELEPGSLVTVRFTGVDEDAGALLATRVD